MRVEKTNCLECNFRILTVSVPVQKPKNMITAEMIMDVVCGVLSVNKEDLKGLSRKREITEARQIYCSLARKYTKKSLGFIGNTVNRDHSTVISSIEVCEDLKGNNAAFREKYNSSKYALLLENKLEEHHEA